MKRTKLAGAGVLLIILSMFLLSFDFPVTGVTYLAGIVLLTTGCFSWACKLHWFVALVFGGMMVAMTFLTSTYIPLIIQDRFTGDERNDFLINLINSLLFWPGIVLISMTPIIAKKNRTRRNEANREGKRLEITTEEKNHHE